MRSSWLYFATRSVRLSEPVLIWPAVGRHGDVGDGRVFGFAGAMADDGGVVVVLGQFDGVERLGERADLVDLDEDRVGRAGINALLQELRRW